MLPETQKLLDDFYSPFNKELAELMDDQRFLFERVSRPNEEIKNQVNSENESFKDRVEDQLQTTDGKVDTKIERDLEYLLDLTEEQVVQRFKTRKELYNRECNIQSDFISKNDLNFTIAQLTNVFYDDRYKLIMCAVPKAATSNWQRVLAVLKYNGTRLPESFQNGNLYNQLNRFSILAKDLGEEQAKLEIMKRFNDPQYLKWINVRHPFARLVSAWRDKFEKTVSGESYWMRKYGKFIAVKFERNEYKPPKSHYISLQARNKFKTFFAAKIIHVVSLTEYVFDFE